MLRALVLSVVCFGANPVFADQFVRITDKADFIGLVGGKSLTRLGITLNLTAAGQIEGVALGQAVTGSWTWEKGYFCRVMQAGSRTFARNCQLVQRRGDVIRFVADKGYGDTADLRLR